MLLSYEVAFDQGFQFNKGGKVRPTGTRPTCSFRAKKAHSKPFLITTAPWTSWRRCDRVFGRDQGRWVDVLLCSSHVPHSRSWGRFVLVLDFPSSLPLLVLREEAHRIDVGGELEEV